MHDKPKRKSPYRDLWAYRGILLASMILIASVGYLLTFQPEYDEIVYRNNGNLWRISLAPNAQSELLVNLEEEIMYTRQGSTGVILYSPRPRNIIWLDTLQLESVNPDHIGWIDPKSTEQRSGPTNSENVSYYFREGVRGHGRITYPGECNVPTLELWEFGEKLGVSTKNFDFRICLLPLWKSDGVHVVLSQLSDDNQRRLILYNVETQNIEILLDDASHIMNLDDWNQDNTAFVFTVYNAEYQTEIWIYDMKRHKARYLAEGDLPLWAD